MNEIKNKIKKLLHNLDKSDLDKLLEENIIDKYEYSRMKSLFFQNRKLTNWGILQNPHTSCSKKSPGATGMQMLWGLL